MFNPNIYRSYDIRGVVPDEFDAEEGYHIGRAYAAFTGAKKVVVARDMRKTGEGIEGELVRGLTEGGINVVKIGLATSPLFYYSVHELKADGGLMVTASHNPGKYNGIKMTREKAKPIGGDTGLMEIRDLVQKREWGGIEKTGSVEKTDLKGAYLDMVCDGYDASGLKIVVDAGNGMAGMLLGGFFERVGGEAVALYWEMDGSFPNHEADPLKEENLQDLKKAVLDSGADFGAAFDGDGDRVFFVTDEGVAVPGDFTTVLIAKEVLGEKPGSKILCDLRSSRVTKEVITEAGGEALMTKVGHSNIKAMMRREGAVFAGELSGHFYFTPYYAESGLLAMAHIIGMLKSSNRKFSELVSSLSKYVKTPEINFEVEDKKGAMERVRRKYADAEIMELDGVSVIYPDWWANMRPSNTEPLLRLNMEADTKELLENKRKEIEGIIQE